jgi:two-component system, OmpR family, response regulator ChvI
MEKTKEITFSDKSQSYCVCFVSMVDSEKVISEIKEADKIRRYYSVFINTMAAIARNFSAKIIKNTGTGLIIYFPQTYDSSNISAFQTVIECGVTMMAANDAINAKLREEGGLPPLHYKISADYGSVEVARSLSSPNSVDLFGSTMNVCAKINSIAPPDNMVIGSDLYYVARKLSSSFGDRGVFDFKRIGEYSVADNSKFQYPVYSVVNKDNNYSNSMNLSEQIPKLKRVKIQGEVVSAQLKELDIIGHSNYAHKNQQQKVEEQQQRSQQQQQNYYHNKILLIDDEPDALLTYKTFLTIEGYDVDDFTDPREALAHFAQSNPDYYNLVVMDIRMPDLNGLQLYYRLKAINPNIRTMFVSALDAAQEMVSILPGVKLDDVVQKPVEQKEFLYKVKGAVE